MESAGEDIYQPGVGKAPRGTSLVKTKLANGFPLASFVKITTLPG